TWDERSARDAVERRHERAGKAGGAGRAGGAGKAYLARKRDLLDVQRVQLKAARAQADRLYRTMARQASRSRRRTATEQAVPGSRLLLDAAFLVPRRRAAAFRSELRRHARALAASGLAVSLTGPWPPYNFI
ncbi:MAG: GvpL/GvpF family gas vesicle protein, partial [Acidobacteria bacterium]|nr:GvpL/GvpF family gas vesicle protein [Acidobacteriota bacterium]